MSLVAAMADLRPDQIKRTANPKPGTPVRTNTTFFRATTEAPDSPSAYIARFDPGQMAKAHFHIVDQFQIILDGRGKFGRHDVSPYCVHFSRAYTPYGPLLSDRETGWAFMGLRARYDPGAQQFPASLEKLKQVPDRRPWQTMKRVVFPAAGSGVCLQDIPGIKDDQGLYAGALAMAPHARFTTPDPSAGDGQFVVVVKGSLVHDHRERKALAVAFLKPEDPPFHFQAGAQGLEALLLNLPQVKPRAVDPKPPSSAAGFKKWQCLLCSFAYDEALGMPEDGVPAGTRWADVPETWTCPDCSASKSDFEMVEV